MNSDRPIQRPEEDVFSRANFAKKFSDSLLLNSGSPGIVFSLEGEWGYGKTSLLNLIEYYLVENNPAPIIVRFNPWSFSGTDQIFEMFFAEFAKAFRAGEYNSKIIEKNLKALSGLLKISRTVWDLKFPGSGLIAGAAAKTLDQVFKDEGVIERKRKVEGEIGYYGYPVVVFIDDIDRLYPEEIRAVIKLVKVIADFSGVAYVLSFDPEPVCKALSFDEKNGGRGFLEKVVQVPISVPRIHPWQLKDFFREKIDDFIKSNNLSLYDFETDRIDEALSSGGVSHALRTPRDAIRAINRLRISALLTRGEVNLGDIVAFEVLANRFPSVASLIRRDPYRFILQEMGAPYYQDSDPLHFDLWDKSEGENKENKEGDYWLKDAVGDELDKKEYIVAKSILEFLFPGLLKSGFGNATDASDARCRLQICTEETLLKMLGAGQVDGIPSVVMATSFLLEPEKREDIERELEGSPDVDGWFHVLSNQVSDGHIADPKGAVLVASRIVENSHYDYDNRFILERAADFIIQVLRQELSIQGKKEILDQIASDGVCVALSENVLLNLVIEHGKWVVDKNRATISPEDRVIKDWDMLSSVLSKWEFLVKGLSKNQDKLLKEKNLLSVLYRWGQFKNHDFDDVKKFVRKASCIQGGLEKIFGRMTSMTEKSSVELLVWDTAEFVKALGDAVENGEKFNQEFLEKVEIWWGNSPT